MTDIERQLEELLIKYSPLLHALVKKYITKDYHDGWDAYQDICLHLWLYIPVKFNPNMGTNLFVYFRRSAINTAKRYKKRRRRPKLRPPIYREHFKDRLMGIWRDQDSMLVEALMQSADSPQKRRVILMCLEGYTPVEIARILKISRSSVYNYFRNYRKILKEYMKDVHF